ncbi:hypothetical protein KFU94_01010 [Chloroflexi bacterium TSY]|nr:hypothetical protein [Chloroflexi bacterium TSY]
MTDAIQKRAEYIYQNTASEDGEVVLRSETEQEIILEIFLGLVEVSLDNDHRRDVRRRRSVKDVIQDDVCHQRDILLPFRL